MPEKTYYFSNVADYRHFSKAKNPGPIPPDLANIPRPIIGFIGAISSYKVDFDLIIRAAELRPDWNWVLIGQVGEGQPSTTTERLKNPNIYLLGPRKYKDLPDYLRSFDIAVLPCPINDYTQSMFPMKFFEYLSAGKPVVATRLDALSDYSDVCCFADTPEEFVKTIDKNLQGNRPDEFLCCLTAASHTWEWRLLEMLKVLETIWNTKKA